MRDEKSPLSLADFFAGNNLIVKCYFFNEVAAAFTAALIAVLSVTPAALAAALASVRAVFLAAAFSLFLAVATLVVVTLFLGAALAACATVEVPMSASMITDAVNAFFIAFPFRRLSGDNALILNSGG